MIPEARMIVDRSVLASLFASRKTAAVLIYVLASLASYAGSKLGLGWTTEAAAATMAPWVMLGLSQIFGIAYEDGQQKRAGAGTTTTSTPLASGGVETTIAPDATGKP